MPGKKIIVILKVILFFNTSVFADNQQFIELYRAQMWNDFHEKLDAYIEKTNKNPNYKIELVNSLIKSPSLKEKILSDFSKSPILLNRVGNKLEVKTQYGSASLFFNVDRVTSATFSYKNQTWHPAKYKTIDSLILDVVKGIKAEEKVSFYHNFFPIQSAQAHPLLGLVYGLAFATTIGSLLSGLPFTLADMSRPEYGLNSIEENLKGHLKQCESEKESIDGNYATFKATLASQMLSGKVFVESFNQRIGYGNKFSYKQFKNPTECQKYMVEEFSDDDEKLLVKSSKIIEFCESMDQLFNCVRESESSHETQSKKVFEGRKAGKKVLDTVPDTERDFNDSTAK